MRRLVVLLVASVLLAAAPALADTAAGAVSYHPPVDGPIVDPFRPPEERWGSGNRGIDYAPAQGTPVQAAADGEVVFAGQVGGELHVVVLHADGIRTSYSFLQSLAVQRGDRVRQGQTVGASAGHLHFGARVGDTYIDPTTLFDGGPVEVHLVPDGERRPGSEPEERAGLMRFLGSVGSTAARAARNVAGESGKVARETLDLARRAAAAGIDAATKKFADELDEFRGLIHYGRQTAWMTHAFRLGRTGWDWWRQRGNCTPGDVRPPPMPERRVAVLLAGLGSTSGPDAIDDLDTAALGYQPEDVVRFSYRGGTTSEQTYSAQDTTTDIRTSARHLRALLERVRREHPGVPVDLIGHGQGGIVGRTMLAYDYEADDPRLPKITNLVTLASPHQGFDIATALSMASHTTSGDLVEWGLSETGVTPFDLRGSSVRQLSETSRFLAKLSRREPPDNVRVTSIGARGDLMVPANHTRLARASNVVVSLPGVLTDHSRLPGSEAGHREVALALAGLPPTCQTLSDMLVDTAVSDVISTAEDAVGAAVYTGGRWVDSRTKTLVTLPRKKG